MFFYNVIRWLLWTFGTSEFIPYGTLDLLVDTVDHAVEADCGFMFAGERERFLRKIDLVEVFEAGGAIFRDACWLRHAR